MTDINLDPTFLTLIDKLAKQRLATNPPNPKNYTHPDNPDLLFYIQAITLGAPPEGSTYTNCNHCGDPIAIGPNQQRVMRTDLRLKALCLPCAAAICMQLGDFQITPIDVTKL